MEQRPCPECGEPLAWAPGRAITHPACALLWKRRGARRRRAARAEQDRERQRDWYWRRKAEKPEDWARHNERAKELRRAQHERMSPEERRALAASGAALARRDQVLTAGDASRHAEPWTAEEDRYLLEHEGLTLRELALALGRTLYGVKTRRQLLRRANHLAGERSP